ncbi:MAG: N-acetyltransferase [Chloroflexota bacterium]|nr:N-acetyltransferase [Chloroflexota bacterium]
MNEINIRPAIGADVPAISELVNSFAARNRMLPRSEAQVSSVLADFLIAEDDNTIIACGSLVALTVGLAEIRSVAVAEAFQGNGLGGRLVAALLELARERELDHVCALTLRPRLFQRSGFHVVDRWTLTPKIWSECVYCPKFHRCDEVAVLIHLEEPGQAMELSPRWTTLARRVPLPVLRRLGSLLL